jgi:multimeric flavodoxin WrbA
VDGVTGPTKNLMDRLLPLVQPFQELSEGHSRHPRRAEVRCRQLVLVSNCGFWELDNFDPMLDHMKAVCKNLRVEFAGELLRPHGPALKPMMAMGMPVDDILAVANEAGRQLVENGEMSPETLKVVSRELLLREMYIQIVNQGFQETLATLEKK